MSSGLLDLLLVPFVACLILTGIHCYLGIHIVSRGVIFVDLSLAQVAALGSAVALLAGYELNSTEAYLISLGFTFLGAGVFALGQTRDKSVPQEAIIGIVYAVSSAAAILVLDKAPHGEEAIKAMLVGSILFATWRQIAEISIVYLGVAVLHLLLRKKFLLISMNPDLARQSGLWIRFWDFLFYITFGFVVTSSVHIAGVLLVFSYLVVPAVCAMFFVRGVAHRLLIGWGLGFVASVLGLYASAKWDFPTGGLRRHHVRRRAGRLCGSERCGWVDSQASAESMRRSSNEQIHVRRSCPIQVPGHSPLFDAVDQLLLFDAHQVHGHGAGDQMDAALFGGGNELGHAFSMTAHHSGS